jgi:hypothetical protein
MAKVLGKSTRTIERNLRLLEELGSSRWSVSIAEPTSTGGRRSA